MIQRLLSLFCAEVEVILFLKQHCEAAKCICLIARRLAGGEKALYWLGKHENVVNILKRNIIGV